MKEIAKFLFATAMTVGLLAGCGEQNNPPEDNPVANTYTITFKNYDNSVLLTLTDVEEGTTPVYTLSAPTRAEDDKYTYTFSDWDPKIVPAVSDATYIATYTRQEKIKDTVHITVNNGNGTGDYKIGSNVTITPNSTTTPFKEWQTNGNYITLNESYTFVASEDMTFDAVYDSNPLAKYTRRLVKGDGEFKILTITDIQLHNGNTLDTTKTIIDTLVKEQNPDLITVLGDTINDSTEYDCDVIAKEIVDLIDSYDIPWAPVFGNHDHEENHPDGTMKTIGTVELEQYFLASENCLYIRGPENVAGKSNYLVNIMDEETGKPVESLVFLDSNAHGLEDTNIQFYKDCIDYTTALNNNTIVSSVVFDHIPVSKFKDEYQKARNNEYRDVIGNASREPLIGGDKDYFEQIKEKNSTTIMICGHDHENSYYTECEGIKLGYSMKSSEGDDADGCSYKNPMGGAIIKLLGEEEKIEYCRVPDIDFTIEAGNHFDYHLVLPYWRYSGATIHFELKLPESGEIQLNLEGTNLLRPGVSYSDRSGSWNRLTNNVKINADTKSCTKGTLTPVEGKEGYYLFSINVEDFELNTSGSELARGDETVKNIFLHSPTANFVIANVDYTIDEVEIKDQIDLAQATIEEIDEQILLDTYPCKPEVKVSLNGEELKDFDDILATYENNLETGTATVKVIPSAKGSLKYKGSVSTTFEISGKKVRGEKFGKGYAVDLPETPLSQTISFDVKFTSEGSATMWFMFGDGWDNYFGYYGLTTDGTLYEKYDGVSVQTTSDEYFRVTCDLSKMNKQNGGTPNPTEKVNLFFVHDSWGGEFEGLIDFEMEDVPDVLRGQQFTGEYILSFDKIEVTSTIAIDFKFTSAKDTYVNFMIGNSSDGWGYYNGYYKLFADGTLEENYDGISVTETADGYFRVTLDLSALTKVADKPKPTQELGYNLFYIRGAWSNASGYVDFNPTI